MKHFYCLGVNVPHPHNNSTILLTSGGIRMVSPDTLAHQTIRYE